MIRPSSFSRVFQLLLPALLLAAATSPALASGAPRCPTPLVPARGLCAFADFDGDRKPDFALLGTRPLPSGGSQLTIRLSGPAGTETLSLDPTRHASAVLSRDVDGDHDLDLVLLQGLRHAVAVFLNDGGGSFSLDSGERYLSQDFDDSGFEAPDVDSPDIVSPAASSPLPYPAPSRCVVGSLPPLAATVTAVIVASPVRGQSPHARIRAP